jgi:hypothetical protein
MTVQVGPEYAVNKDERIIDLIPMKDKIGIIYKDNPVVQTPEEIDLTKYRERHSTAKSIDVDSANEIVQKLKEVGCITNESINTYSLKSPREKSQGGYYTRKDNPIWINHGGREGRRVEVWLLEEWGVEFELPRYEVKVEDEITTLAERFKNKVAEKDIPEFSHYKPDFVDCYSRKERNNLTIKAYNKWKRLNQNKIMLLYAFEGFGKSRIVNILVDDKQKVALGCKTNEQSEEQFFKFNEQGLKVQLLLSREYKMKKLGPLYADCIVTATPKHPWDTPGADESATKSNLIGIGHTKEEADFIWLETASDKMDWDNHDVIIMTHTRLALIGRIQEFDRRGHSRFGFTLDWEPIIPTKVICIWDDCDRTDFAWLSPYDNKYAGLEIDGKLVETKSFKKVNKNKLEYEAHYFIKPECFRYGFGIHNRQIYSTTEEITTFLIQRYVGKENLFVPKLMPEDKMKAGNITIFKTKMTGRNKDGLLLPLLSRVKKEGYDFYTIGDSISPINHTNNKGQNIYDDKHIVVEISQMNMVNIPQWLDELGWSKVDPSVQTNIH